MPKKARDFVELQVSETVVCPSSKKQFLTVLILWFGTFLVALDTSIIGVTLPKISKQFNALHDVGWYVSVYLLTLTAMQPFFGQLDKYFQPKLLYMISIGIFEAGSAISGGAQQSHVFISGRAIAGFGAAGLYQGALAIINAVIPREKRPGTIGAVMSVFLVALSIGPPLGGVIASSIGWRWCFLINLPTGATIFIVIFFLLKTPSEPSDQPFERHLPLASKLSRLDFVGLAFLFSACVCLFLAFEWGVVLGDWKSTSTIGAFAGSGILAGAFIVHEWALGDDAMLPSSVFGQHSILMSCVFLGFSQASSYVLDTYLSFFFQDYLEFSAGASGARFLILIGPQILTLVLSSNFSTRGGILMVPMVLGQIIASISLSMLIFNGMQPHAHPTKWIVPLIFTGIGIGTGVSMPFSIVQSVFTDPASIALANGAVNFSGQLGGAMGVQIAQIIFLTSGGTANARIAVQQAMYVAFGAALVALLAAIHVERRRVKTVQRKPDGPLPESRVNLTDDDPEQQMFHSTALDSRVSLVSLHDALTDLEPPQAAVTGNVYVHQLEKMPSRHLKLRAVPSAQSALRPDGLQHMTDPAVEVDGSLGMMSTWDGTKDRRTYMQTSKADFYWANEMHFDSEEERLRLQDLDHGYSLV